MTSIRPNRRRIALELQTGGRPACALRRAGLPPIHNSRSADNRPVRWVKGDEVISMSFDRQGRRVAKNNQRFVYDGYLCIKGIENTATIHYSLSPIHCFVWDPTENVATRPLVWNRGGDVAYYAHDGNKNVSDVVASNGAVVAHYDYAPFGAVIAQSGALADANSFGFSSEYADRDLGLVYYNYRHYDPVTGRWASRDPIEERGGIALYGFVGNRVQMRFDRLGRGFFSSCKKIDGPHKKEGAEWVLVSVEIDMSKTKGEVTFYGFNLKFSLEGEATCCCRNWLTKRRWTEKRTTHKILKVGRINFNQDATLMEGLTPNGGVPMGLPLIKNIADGVGQVVGVGVQVLADGLVFAEQSTIDAINAEISAGIREHTPSGDGSGKWRPEDPC